MSQASFFAASAQWPWADIIKGVFGLGTFGVVGKQGWKCGKAVQRGVKRLSDTMDTVDRIAKQVFPNGGSSLADTLDRMEDAQSINIAVTRLLTSGLSVPAIAYGDKAGRCIWVSERYTDITGLTNDEASGSGWVNAIHPEDRPRVVQESDEAWEEKRTFMCEFRFQHVITHAITPVYCKSEIVRGRDGTARGAVATIRTDTRINFTDRRMN